ncbi:PmoA family protein [Actinoplanes sp. N902-109]|uniref:DUF6807 domain-containing protein n=1 Tax=Actinoplanes sp. (strain N902-109) TaxID=649831 RepID=UPI000329397C|nr:PmoA family protein [Actinoplanes sp. N902-109]AGL17293.1 hypothetical protein L083_3783 [Actinoplanes sp. N902-109]
MSTSEIRIGDVPVATCVTDPQLDIRLGPRPYLHPVRTLNGVTVTDALCQDHPWHLGASVALQDVNGVNFWGGRTYVRDRGYTWLDDHGRITPELEWQDQTGKLILTEDRTLAATLTPGGWRLHFSYALSAPADTDVVLGSPATNGRPGGAGYGGFFWRAATDDHGEAVAWTADAVGEHNVNGSAAPWLALRVGSAYTLIFEGLRDADRWFVRTGEYAGVCAALAFERPLSIAAGTTLSREIRVTIADGIAGPPQPPMS